ncbi:hypothetical protein LTR36_005501 [Oleoguttula mirabilis]|uniref:Uncharacterized protein n=1 Tax=Oleoguttula mirabilis TaxID=1507867 RepID=A0AAV9JEZ9_9PEZI|nr:hypothetical protein LTR36_005501 [Oleoguttula mirabilis]
MDRQSAGGHEMRKKSTVNYAESEVSSAHSSPKSTSSFGENSGSSKTSLIGNSKEESEDELMGDKKRDSEDELQSSDVVHAVPRRTATRELPSRSARKQVSYATPVKKYAKKTMTHRKADKLLTSDTNKPAHKPVADTARGRVRHDILEHTKPKRDAFVLAYKDHFLPVLPETANYIDKLERIRATSDKGSLRGIVKYTAITKQPREVKAVMKPYQLEGLSFLVHMFHNGMSAILGDEMGLGKTLQTLALFQYLAENEPTHGENRPHLVVCPLSVLSSWINEARKWVPGLNVIRFHGPKAERDMLKKDLLATQAPAAKKSSKGLIGATVIDLDDDDSVDIVVTTYETFVAEQSWFKRAFAWRYCVLDEGHKIKNEKSNMASALQSLQAEYRLLLTGTPLQNNLKEAWALFHWLFPEVFPENTSDRFQNAFDLTQGKVSTGFMDDARRLLELVMLRRMKSSPGVNLGLPPKTEVLLYVPLTPMQRFWYTRLLTKADNGMLNELFKGAKDKEKIALQQESQEDKQLSLLEQGAAVADAVSEGGPGDSDVWAEQKEIMERAVNSEGGGGSGLEWKKMMMLMVQLRKACNHPYLMPNAAPEPYYLGEHIKTASGKFIVLDKLVEELVVKQRKKVLIFSGFTSFLNLCEDLLALKGANTHDPPFRYVRFDGSTARAKRNLGIRMFNDASSDFRVMLISTRAGGLGVNLAAASDVIFMDEDWNPQVTLQAEARAHRIGQTNPVTVYKICTSGTVEEQMMGRIRKKLYLSAKITESMRNIHSGEDQHHKKRKRVSENVSFQEDEPPLGVSQLKSLLRKGAQTLVRPEVDVTAMLDWDFQTMIDKCKDNADDPTVGSRDDGTGAEADEEAWLNSMEKVECAVFEGRKHQRQLEKAIKENTELARADRRVGKNTTVMIDGFAINKESLQCADWEAVPTMAGKDPRLAEPVRAKRAKIVNQDYCQHCWDGGEIVLCSGCPRSYHTKCLSKEWQVKAKGKMNFFCPQHQCVDCDAKTGEAGGMIFRCRWCQNGYCEDCLDFETAKLLGDSLPELEMLGFGAMPQAWFVDCAACVKHWETNPGDAAVVAKERKKIEKEYRKFVAQVDGLGLGIADGSEIDGAVLGATDQQSASKKTKRS